MATNLFLNKYRIDSARATWHDYNGGIYFITICTAHKQCYFGTIDQGSMILNALGHFLKENLEQVKDHYSHIEIPMFVVMPNHVHAIVFVGDERESHRDGAFVTKSLLSVAIGGIKSATTVYARRNNINFAWQTRFHDHIIRNREEANRIADYIENNPQRWYNDCFYTVPSCGDGAWPRLTSD